MKTIKQSYTIHAPAAQVWDALVNPQKINKWGGGPAKMTEKEGESFSLWGGEIFGKNRTVIQGKELIQEWFGGKWDEPSIVTFSLKEEKNDTHVSLLQTNIPDSEAKDIEQGWKDYYMGSLKQWVESE